jgi:ABC-2 type transport system ATP-binding protein
MALEVREIKEMLEMYDEIVGFAELEDFMDQKLKNYSSGMQVRLAFSIAIRADTEILVLDEVLAVGDEAFQRKCNKYFEKVKKDKNKTIVLVTHSMEAVRKYCNKAMLIKDGKMEAIGLPEDVANRYTLENFEARKGVENKVSSNFTASRKLPSAHSAIKVKISSEYSSFSFAQI